MAETYVAGKSLLTIPSKVDQNAHRRAKGTKGGTPPAFDSENPLDGALPWSAGSNRLKRNGAVAPRFDTLAVRYEATAHIAAINE